MRGWKRGICILLIVIITVSLSGCWDKRELSELAVVMGIALDVGSGENGEMLTICAQIANPVSSGGSSGSGGAAEQTYNNFSGSGGSVFEILRGMTHKSSRRLYNSHNQVILFSRELAETQGLGEIIDFFLRDNEIRYNILIAVTEGKAADTLDVTPEYENIPAREIEELIRNQTANSESATCTLLNFVQCGLTAGKAALVPLIKLVESSGSGEGSSSESGGGDTSGGSGGSSSGGDNSESESGGSGGSGGGSSGGGSSGGSSSGGGEESGGEKQSKRLEISGSAVFDGGKMVGTLSKEETWGALWVRGGANAGIVSVEVEDVKAEIEVLDSEQHMSVDIREDGTVIAEVRCVITANVGEVNGQGVSINKEFVQKLSSACAEKVKKEIQMAYGKSAKLGCDVFGFGEYLYRNHLKKWRSVEEDWPEHYRSLSLSIHVQVDIEELGELTAGVPLRGTVRNGEENS